MLFSSPLSLLRRPIFVAIALCRPRVKVNSLGPWAERIENHAVHRQIEDQWVDLAALGSIIMDRTAAIDEKNTMAINIVELQIVIVVDEAEVLSYPPIRAATHRPQSGSYGYSGSSGGNRCQNKGFFAESHRIILFPTKTPSFLTLS